jgi:TIR domain
MARARLQKEMKPEQDRAERTKLHVFISYASEDAALAQAINAALRSTFGYAVIKTTLDVELKVGTEWRAGLERALDEADILLIVATGRQKLSHSYTGFEVGYFKSSKRLNPKMGYFKSDRLIIPIGFLEKINDAISDIKTLNLTGQLLPFLVDENTLKSDRQAEDRDLSKSELMKLFTCLKEVVCTVHRFDDEMHDDFRKKAKDSVGELYKAFLAEFQKRVANEKFPERKIIIRLPQSLNVGKLKELKELQDKTTLEFVGESFELFRISPHSNQEISWAEFANSVSHDSSTTTGWNDIIKSLIEASRQDDFAENRRLLASSDGKRFFRLFIGRSVVYYSGTLELHVYVVEVKSRDFGDPTTTMLLKAISVGLTYRFLFLEGRSSEFSTDNIRATLPRDLPKAISNLLQELEYLVWLSNDAGLSKPMVMTKIYGGFGRGELEAKAMAWERLKSKLEEGALEVLRSAADDDKLAKAKDRFEDALSEFCAATAPMNREFLDNVLSRLQSIVLRPIEYEGGQRAAS